MERSSHARELEAQDRSARDDEIVASLLIRPRCSFDVGAAGVGGVALIVWALSSLKQ